MCCVIGLQGHTLDLGKAFLVGSQESVAKAIRRKYVTCFTAFFAAEVSGGGGVVDLFLFIDGIVIFDRVKNQRKSTGRGG